MRHRNIRIILSIGLIVIALSVAAIIDSCQFFSSAKTNDTVLARTSSAVLTMQQVAKLIPDNMKGADSVRFVQNYVDRWIHNQLMLEKAIDNIDDKSYASIEDMVNDYRTALLVYKYQQLYIEQNLDTLILDSQIADHYEKYGNNFLLDSCAVRVIFVQIPKSLPDGVRVRNLIRSNKAQDMIELEEFCFKNARNFDPGVNWCYLHEAVNLMPPGSVKNPLAFAQNGRSVEAQDSLYNYFWAVKEFRNVNEQAPLILAKEKIREILLNHRKNDLIRDLEIKIYVDAVNKQRFTNYVN